MLFWGKNAIEETRPSHWQSCATNPRKLDFNSDMSNASVQWYSLQVIESIEMPYVVKR